MKILYEKLNLELLQFDIDNLGLLCERLKRSYSKQRYNICLFMIFFCFILYSVYCI